MKSLKTHINEAFVNEAADPKKLLAGMYELAKKSKNFSKVTQITDKEDLKQYDNAQAGFEITSKLKGQNDDHKHEVDTFFIGIDEEDDVYGLYGPSGYDEVFKTLADFKKFTRA